MSYTQTFEACFPDHQGNAALQTFLNSKALDTFREAYKAGEIAPLSWANENKDIEGYKKALAHFSVYEDVLILGTGGSSLGAKTLCSLAPSKGPRLHFHDNIDPHTFKTLFQTLDLEKTGVLGISKSGSTVETLMQLMVCLEHYGKRDTSKHFLIVTEPKENPLRKLAATHNWPCLDHPTDVGGRYSCFTLVGLLPAILAGLDVSAFRDGGKDVLETHLKEETPPALEGAAMSIYLLRHSEKNISVMFPYADQLKSFSAWYCQLWAESLGKHGNGTTPVKALGTVDQHSQLQLYLDGPKDKFFTLISKNWKGKGHKITRSDLPEFEGKHMGDLFAAELRATFETLIFHHCPTRLIKLSKIDEYHLGALMMHFMIETILTSYLLDVDAFDQPAVERGKRLAREYLKA